MAYPVFVLPEGIGVDSGVSISVRPRVRRAGFGVGLHRSSDGLNTMPKKVDVSFSLLTPEQSQQISEFFDERKGYLPFMWTLPDEAKQRQWICTEWLTTTTGPAVLTISAKFEETFDP